MYICINIACQLESLCDRDHVHMIDNKSSNKIILKGFTEEFKTTQVSAKKMSITF